VSNCSLNETRATTSAEVTAGESDDTLAVVAFVLVV
jgi:hypothetical protein